jgi:hypothetical protein
MLHAASQNRDRREGGVWNGPGSALHRQATLQRVRDTVANAGVVKWACSRKNYR